MRLRTPPGRAGRLWLRGRLASARKATDLLDHKRRELEGELRRVRGIAAPRAASWGAAAREAAVWLARVETTGGARALRLATALHETHAEIAVQWQQVMGVRYPTACTVRFPPEVSIHALEGGAALAAARAAHRRAGEAGIEHAVAAAALACIQSELDRTVRRLRALQLRAIPAHERALAALELALDEKDRQDAVAGHWAAGEAPGGAQRSSALGSAGGRPQ